MRCIMDTTWCKFKARGSLQFINPRCILVHSRNTRGEPELIIIHETSQWCLRIVAYSSTSEQLTCRLKFSVMPMSIWTLQNSSIVSLSVISHRHNLILLDHYTAPLSQLAQSIYLVCLHINLPVIVNNLHGRRQLAPPRLDSLFITHLDTSIISLSEYTERFRVYTGLRNQGATNVG